MEGSCLKLNAQNNLISDLNLGTSVLSLQEINLSHNKLGNLQDICKCLNLIELNLDDNLIDNIGTCFYQMTKLKKLSLQRNRIHKLYHNDFNAENSIQHLNLAFNKLVTFDEYEMFIFRNMRYLNLNGNMIYNISHNIYSRMMSLREIGLSYNKFQCIDLYKLLNTIPKNTNYLFIDKKLSMKTLNIFGIHCYMNLKELSRYRLKDTLENLKTVSITHTSLNRILIIKCCGMALDVTTCTHFFDSLHKFKINCKNSTYLDLSSNIISSYDVNAFHSFSILKGLNLSHNNISSLTKPLFKPGQYIKELDLSNNKITNISEEVLKEVNIKKIILRSNFLENFDTNLFNIQECELLDLSYNKLKSFSFESFLMKNLTLNLQFNELTYLHVNNLNITFLDASNNKIKSVVLDGFCQKFHAQNNLISEISLGTTFSSLLEINLSNNKLENNIQDICKCLNLIELNLDENMIDNIGTCFYQMTKLEKLSLQRNHIHQFYHDEFSEMNSIQHLNLAFNKLVTFDEYEMFIFRSIRYLNLNGNMIDNISNNIYSSMFALREIGLSYNKFKCIDLYKFFDIIPRNKNYIFIEKITPMIGPNINGIDCIPYFEKKCQDIDKKIYLKNNSIIVLGHDYKHNKSSRNSSSFYEIFQERNNYDQR
uniref:Uncharacterized protein n=1 Tax=Lutzomyia longipalpis TaxID=7200 RepID=A0A1B0GL80_LUTLO